MISRSLLLTSFCTLALAVSSLAESKPASALAATIQPFVQDQTIPGAVLLVISPDRVLALEAHGKQGLQDATPMPKDAMFWIASMTKPITACAVMMLVEEGKVNIQDPVSKYLPEFEGQRLQTVDAQGKKELVKPTRPITLQDLLTHTSGLVSKSPADGQAIDTQKLDVAVRSYAQEPLQFEPGSKWSYNNPGINTLGRIVEVVSGQSFDSFIQERLFTPLGMKDTTFWPTEEQVPRIAKAVKMNAAKTALEETPVTRLSQPLTNRDRMVLPAGGLFSTAADLGQFYRMILQGGELGRKRYLKAETLATMLKNYSGELKAGFTPGLHMGLGWQVVSQPEGPTVDLSPGSFGHGGAYGTQAWLDPDKKLGYVLLIQRADLGNGDASEIRRAFQHTAAQIFAKETKPEK